MGGSSHHSTCDCRDDAYSSWYVCTWFHIGIPFDRAALCYEGHIDTSLLPLPDNYRTCHDDSFVNRHEHHTRVCVHKYPHKWVSLVYMAAHTKPFHMDSIEPLSVDMDHMNQNDRLFHICDFHS